MARNYMADVAKMLGVELNDEFELNGSNAIYKLSQYGFFFKSGGAWMRASDYLLIDIIRGEYEIKKLPWKPKEGERYYLPDERFSSWAIDSWQNRACDFALFGAGMAFKTVEDCKAALPMLRKKYLGGGNNEID